MDKGQATKRLPFFISIVIYLRSSRRSYGNLPSSRTMTVCHHSPFLRALVFLCLIPALLACDLTALIRGDKPVAIILSPPSGSGFSQGDEIAVQSSSTDQAGIARVELLVDGQVVRTDTSPSPQNQYTLIQTWQATQGTHTIAVRAYDIQNNVSNPAAIEVRVSPAAASQPSATSTPTPGAGNPSPTPAECLNNSAFVADVTVPDGSQFAPNQSFNKIWRVKNTGTCTWGAGYQFIYIGGDALTPNTVFPVPNTAPGASADFLVPMNAPRDTGSHVGTWRLKSPNGSQFGTIVTVKITVPGAVSPTNPVATSCSGTPSIPSFTADAGLVTWGGTTNLRWSQVTNADSVDIDQGIGGIGAGPGGGTMSISPTRTTTYTMTAHCGSNFVQRQVTVLVPFAVTSVVGTVDPTSSTSCNQTFTFHFTISVNSAGTVEWRRERSDTNILGGSYTFGDAGSFVADYTWQPNGPSGTSTQWIQVHTLTPTDVTSNQAAFALTCP